MSYETVEASAFDGKPVELYEFTGPGVWRYTSADEPIEHDGNLYASLPGIRRDNIVEAMEEGKNDLKVSLDAQSDLMQYLVTQPQGPALRLRIYGLHRGVDGFIIAWSGRVDARQFGETEATLTCVHGERELEEPVALRASSRRCTHSLYGPLCRVPRENFLTAGTVESISGLGVVVPAASGQADGWFDNGYLEYALEGVTYRRYITAHAGQGLMLDVPFYGPTGTPVSLFPGCAHNKDDCANKFSNGPNYGGQTLIPTKNYLAGETDF